MHAERNFEGAQKDRIINQLLGQILHISIKFNRFKYKKTALFFHRPSAILPSMLSKVKTLYAVRKKNSDLLYL
jgi:hypothetical protein